MIILYSFLDDVENAVRVSPKKARVRWLQRIALARKSVYRLAELARG
jgi:hypothetical protein